MRVWAPEEDRLIIEMLAQHGSRWAKIVKELPGRTISSVRNRWQRIDRGRRITQSGKVSKNRCQWCGQPKRGHLCFARMQPQPSEVKEECPPPSREVKEECPDDTAVEIGEQSTTAGHPSASDLAPAVNASATTGASGPLARDMLHHLVFRRLEPGLTLDDDSSDEDDGHPLHTSILNGGAASSSATPLDENVRSTGWVA